MSEATSNTIVLTDEGWMNGWRIYYVGVDKKTGEERPAHPKDVPNSERFDGFARAFGYRRISPI